MQKPSAFILAPLILLAGLASLIVLARAWDRNEAGAVLSSSTNVLGNPPGMIDRLVTLDAPANLLFSHDEVIPISADLRASDRRRPGQRLWTSPICQTDFPFTELLPSWNALIPDSAAMRVDVRIRDQQTAAWSPWLYVGSWGTLPPDESRPTTFPGGVVHIDVLVLHHPADAFQFRITVFPNGDAPVSPQIRRLTAAYSGVAAPSIKSAATGPWQSIAHPPPTLLPACDLPIPFRTQQHAPPALRGEICSPTSISMVLEYFGVNRPTVENAHAIYDPDARIYGNWNRAVQFCAHLGLRGYLTRFRNWDNVKAHLAAGQPIIASIKFRPGEFPSSVLLNGTAGHLLVIRGFTSDGRIVVNDPASATRGRRALYDADDFARAWFNNGGVAYVIHP